MEKMLGNKKYILIFILPALLLFLGFTLIPLITSGVYSFFEYNGIGSKTFIGIKNYIELFTSDRYFPQAVKNSLILVAASLFIQLPISIILAINTGITNSKTVSPTTHKNARINAFLYFFANGIKRLIIK